MIRYNPKGLSSQEAADSRRTHGDNVITPPKDDSAWKLFVEKFKDPIIRILLLAAVLLLSFLVRAPKKAVAFTVNSIAGGLALLALVHFGDAIGVELFLNGWTVSAAVLLGVPGVLALLALQWIF